MEILIRHPQPRRAWGRLAAVLAALLLSIAPVGAQAYGELGGGVTAPMLKAAFLYNFANFAEWPARALTPRQPLALCVVGDEAVADALQQTIRGRKVEDHELTVEIIRANGPIHSCHLLYISGLDKTGAGALLSSLKHTAVLTVSDGEHFAAMGGVAQLILENGRMRFSVNVGATNRAHLKISSKLLRLATIVKDQPDVHR